MAAGGAVLEALTPDDYATLEATATRLFGGLAERAKDAGVDASVVRVNTFGCVFFTPDPPRDFAGADADRQGGIRYASTAHCANVAC